MIERDWECNMQIKKEITTLLSSGYGRLHLAQSAEYLGKADVAVKLICGWVPKNPNSWLVKLCSKVVGRNLSPGLRKRAITLPKGGKVYSCAWADFFCQGLFWIERKLFKGRFNGFVASLSWKVFGWQMLRYINKFARGGNVVFHVRSGAGHGGAIQLAKKNGVPVIVDHSIAHPAYMEKHLRPEYEKNGAVFDLGMSSPFWRLVAEDCEWADVLLVNSYFVRDTFIEQGFSANKIRIAYLGVRSDFFGLREIKINGLRDRKIKLLFTGGFGFRKGGEYIFEALKILRENMGDVFEMDVVGSYAESEALIKKYERHHLPITFHGYVPQDDLKDFLANSDIYVFPSLSEGCASSGMEAMAAGLCVVATKESGLPIDDGINGCIVPPKDAQKIAEKIQILLESPSEIDRMGASAAKLIRENYTWEKYAETVKSIYSEALGAQ